MSDWSVRFLLALTSLMFVASAYVSTQPLSITRWDGWMGFLGMIGLACVISYQKGNK